MEGNEPITLIRYSKTKNAGGATERGEIVEKIEDIWANRLGFSGGRDVIGDVESGTWRADFEVRKDGLPDMRNPFDWDIQDSRGMIFRVESVNPVSFPRDRKVVISGISHFSGVL